MSHNPLNALTKRVAELEKLFHLLRDTPWQRDVETVGDSASAHQKQNEIGQDPTILPHGNPALKHTEKYENKWYNSCKWWKSKPFHWYKDRLELIALVAGVGYALVTYFQWRDLQNHFAIEQRAWVEATLNYPTTLTEDAVIGQFPISINNSGKNPAFEVIGDGIVEIVDKSKGPTLNFSAPHRSYHLAMLFPGREGKDAWAEFYENNKPRNVKRGEIISLLHGDTYLAEFVQFRYRDQFGWHWTRVCGWHGYHENTLGGFNAISCTAWNTVGDGDPPK